MVERKDRSCRAEGVRSEGDFVVSSAGLKVIFPEKAEPAPCSSEIGVARGIRRGLGGEQLKRKEAP
jgi:hypothetical protein